MYWLYFVYDDINKLIDDNDNDENIEKLNELNDTGSVLELNDDKKRDRD